MGSASDELRNRLTKLGRAYTRGYEVQYGRRAKRINEDNVTTWNDQQGAPVTAEEDEDTGGFSAWN